MALKDWKKISEIEDWRTKWENKKTKKVIYVLWNEGFTSWRFGNYNSIDDKLFNKKTLRQNKRDAFKFAKSYMRTH